MDVLTRFADDSAKSIKLTFLSIINTIIYSNVQEYVVNPCYDVVCAATKKIGKTLEFIKYINLFYLCGHISDRIISDYILDIIDPYVSNIASDVRISDLGSMNSFLSASTNSLRISLFDGPGSRPVSTAAASTLSANVIMPARSDRAKSNASSSTVVVSERREDNNDQNNNNHNKNSNEKVGLDG